MSNTNTTWGVCPRCKHGTPVEHTRLYGCEFDDLHDFEAATRTAPNPPGLTSQRVAANVRLLRRRRGWRLADLAEALAGLERPLSVSTLSKLEKCQRGIDVDELVVLAVAFGTSPSALLT